MSMKKESDDKSYCYPGTNVLKNKANITNLDELNVYERKITYISSLKMIDRPVKGDFDREHLCEIHKEYFSEIYEWAGKFRTVDIAKSNLFCRAIFLDDMASDIFNRIESDHFLIGMPEDIVFSKLAIYMGDINALHPFREGNGRTQREFIYLLGQATGYKLNYSLANEDEMMDASLKSFICDYSGFEKIFKRVAEPMTINEQYLFLSKVSKKGLKIFERMLKENNLPERKQSPHTLLDLKVKRAEGKKTKTNIFKNTHIDKER